LGYCYDSDRGRPPIYKFPVTCHDEMVQIWTDTEYMYNISVFLTVIIYTPIFFIKFTIILIILFSSPELKAQVSFSDRPLSVVCRSVCLSVCLLDFYIFDFFSRTTWPILSKLGMNHPWGKGIQIS
jgi:hypothetical protein